MTLIMVPTATREEIEFRIREFVMLTQLEMERGEADHAGLWAKQAARLGRVLLREDGLLGDSGMTA